MSVLKRLEGKKIFAVINTQGGQRQYSGKCVEVTDLGNGFVLVGIIDKYNKFVAFNSNEIHLIQEEFSNHDGRKREKDRGRGDDARAT